MVSVDGRGRVADRAVLRVLGWVPGDRLEVRALESAVLVRRRSDGIFAVTGQGYVRLPVAARRWCGLYAGDRVLLVADRGVLVVHTMGSVAALVADRHEALGVGA
ncbi:AbrB/MazE/SpoVT family DNA-binding domain-containing protein [Saccharopolyspora cebuensis]|uniref:AbrB/MazE/SpoVT family DNA-binding domain-containing protein n=1 Tax=Saccharopolyspora cebuensis TaxID=418759 RepID=A0ABV4CQU2_9PSEU